MKRGTLLIAGGVALLFLGYQAKRKVERLAAIFSSMTIKPYGLPRDVKLVGLKNLSFVTDIILENPTAEDFSVSGYIAVLESISVHYRDRYLGSALVDVEEVSVPANRTLVLHDLKVTIATGEILDNLFDLYLALSGGGDPWGEVTFKGVIDAPGGPYQIG